MPDNQTYSIARDGNTIGQFTLAQVREGLKAGQLKISDHYWTQGMGDWQKVGSKDWSGESKQEFVSSAPWYRLADQEVIAGVCAGLGLKFGNSPWFVRTLFILGLPLGSWFLYLLMWLFFSVEYQSPSLRAELESRSQRPAGFAKFFKLSGCVMLFFLLLMIPVGLLSEQPGDVSSETSRRSAYGYATSVLTRNLAQSAILLPPRFDDYESCDGLEFKSYRDRSTVVVLVTFSANTTTRTSLETSRRKFSVAYLYSEHRPIRETLYASAGNMLLEGDDEFYNDCVMYAKRGELGGFAKMASGLKKQR